MYLVQRNQSLALLGPGKAADTLGCNWLWDLPRLQRIHHADLQPRADTQPSNR